MYGDWVSITTELANMNMVVARESEDKRCVVTAVVEEVAAAASGSLRTPAAAARKCSVYRCSILCWPVLTGEPTAAPASEKLHRMRDMERRR